MGTLINTGAVVVGSLLGLVFKKIIPHRLNDLINKAIGLCVAIVGLLGVITACVTVGEDGVLSSNGSLLLIVSMALGIIAGELLRLDDRLMSFGRMIEKRLVKNPSESSFAEGFVSASILFCVGAMAIVGSLEDGMTGNYQTLLIKSLLDGIIAVFMAASLGVGVLFAAVPVFIYQGAITLAASAVAPLASDFLLNNIFMVGYAIVIIIGLNMLGLTKLKTFNFVPALLIPVLYSLIF